MTRKEVVEVFAKHQIEEKIVEFEESKNNSDEKMNDIFHEF